MGHSLASAVLGLVGQPKLQKWVQKELGTTGILGQSGTNLVASAVVSPIYGAPPPLSSPPCPLGAPRLGFAWFGSARLGLA